MFTIIGTTPFLCCLSVQRLLFVINTKHETRNDNKIKNILLKIPVILLLLQRVYIDGLSRTI